MPDFILIDGDAAVFDPRFSAGRTIHVGVKEGKIRGSGAEKVKGVRICVKGDEKSVSIPACSYMIDPKAKGGFGTLSIKELGSNHKAMNRKIGGQPVLLKGGNFIALFSVTAPAMGPGATAGSVVPDMTRAYLGHGSFITKNSSEKAS